MNSDLDDHEESIPSFDIGPRLQAVRRASGLSQREVARRAGMTNGTLSLIEQSKVSPSISSLEKILHVIPMSLTEFFSDTLDISPPVFCGDDFVLVSKNHVQTHVMELSELSEQHVSLAKQYYQPGARVSSDWMVRKGYIAGIVVDGTLSLILDGKSYTVHAGEGFHFSVLRQHQFMNETESVVELIAVSVS